MQTQKKLKIGILLIFLSLFGCQENLTKDQKSKNQLLQTGYYYIMPEGYTLTGETKDGVLLENINSKESLVIWIYTFDTHSNLEKEILSGSKTPVFGDTYLMPEIFSGSDLPDDFVIYTASHKKQNSGQYQILVSGEVINGSGIDLLIDIQGLYSFQEESYNLIVALLESVTYVKQEP